jgi:hypothetical protein
MSPILGIIASSNFQRVTSSYESIATASGTGSASTITFSSIPSTYTHLEIRYIARTTGTYTYEDSKFRFNSQTSGYAFHVLNGDGATASAGASTSTAYIGVGLTTGSTGTASAYGVGVVSILDYTNTNKNKTYRILTGEDRNGAGHIQLGSGLYSANTNAISSITIDTVSGNWTTDSKFALYGIKGA